MQYRLYNNLHRYTDTIEPYIKFDWWQIKFKADIFLKNDMSIPEIVDWIGAVQSCNSSWSKQYRPYNIVHII